MPSPPRPRTPLFDDRLIVNEVKVNVSLSMERGGGAAVRMNSRFRLNGLPRVGALAQPG